MKIKQKLEKGKKENPLRGPKVAKTLKSGGGAKFKIAGISKMPKQILKPKKVSTRYICWKIALILMSMF